MNGEFAPDDVRWLLEGDMSAKEIGKRLDRFWKGNIISNSKGGDAFNNIPEVKAALAWVRARQTQILRFIDVDTSPWTAYHFVLVLGMIKAAQEASEKR